VPSLFAIDGEMIVPTEHSRGPWDPKSCHGGPLSALMVHATEHVDGDAATWQTTRVTVELLRPVPVLEPMVVRATVDRPGRAVSLVSATATSPDGVDLVRALVLRIRRDAVPITDEHVPEPIPFPVGSGARGGPTWADESFTAFHKDSVELRFADGAWEVPGPVMVWGQLLVPLFEGEEPSPAQRWCALGDFGNGISAELDATTTMFINPDLTIHLLRPPEGAWVGLASRSFYGDQGAGVAESALYDERGRVGRAVQSLFLASR
jgi:hypothetical protein